jgi:hypothetical protein
VLDQTARKIGSCLDRDVWFDFQGKSSAGKWALTGLITATGLVSVTFGYASYDPEFRYTRETTFSPFFEA